MKRFQHSLFRLFLLATLGTLGACCFHGGYWHGHGHHGYSRHCR